MSREVDPNSKSLSKEDKIYLAQRGTLPTSTMDVYSQQALLDPEKVALADLANTGDVNTVNISKDEYAELLELRAAMEKVDDPRKLQDLSGEAAATADDEDEDDSYEAMTVPQLRAELGKRNEDRDADDQLPLTGTKPELIARLEEDDASEDDES